MADHRAEGSSPFWRTIGWALTILVVAIMLSVAGIVVFATITALAGS